ncbi:MAG: hypothetical protein RMJ39_10840 [Deltaproteobacteria bacterium]|nr:hypothetical protein [Deltaproteobacteria bacterium]
MTAKAGGAEDSITRPLCQLAFSIKSLLNERVSPHRIPRLKKF